MPVFNDNPLARFHPHVLAFTRPAFSLRDDLARLCDVWRAGAPEAVALYAARALDALAAAALEQASVPVSRNVYLNLNLLQQLHLIPETALYWAHALRRLGNDVRHLRRAVTADDSELAAAFLEQVLAWFFRDFPFGARLPVLADGPGLPLAAELRAIFAAFDAPDFDPCALFADLWPRQPACLSSPALLGILAERLHERDAMPEAECVLAAGLAVAPGDVRLRQLMGVHWSRQGAMARALAWLEPLYAGAEAVPDEETAGIIAGIYKRGWLDDRTAGKWLARAHRAYLVAWEAFSGRQNAYLGINAAATALWQGHAVLSRRIAKAVGETLRQRQAFFAAHAAAPATLTFWERVTGAEALLLLGLREDARRAYRAAFADFPARHGAIVVSRQQAAESLRALGVAETLDDWLARPDDVPPTPVAARYPQ